MKILFVGLNSYYTEGLNYQENDLCKAFIDAGHSVAFISNPEAYVNGIKTYLGATVTTVDNGVKLIRVDYKFDKFFSKKFKIFKSIYSYIVDFKPDIIFCHSPQYFSVFDVIKYKINNKYVLLYADTHTGYYNVDITKWYFSILYKFYYRRLYKSLEPYLEKYFYIGPTDKQFSLQVFNANESIMAYFPLGGFAIDEEDYNRFREEKRIELGFNNNDIVLIHSGKLDSKKNTNWIINVVNLIGNSRLKLVVIGSIPNDNAELFEAIKNNKNRNILYLGWKNSHELLKYICAGDIYVQPGTQSITFNNSICCQTPLIAFKHKSYSLYYDLSSIIWINSFDDLKNDIVKLITDESLLSRLKAEAKKNKYFIDYRQSIYKLMNIKV